MRIAIIGSSGLVGARLIPFLVELGHHPVLIKHGRDYDAQTGVINEKLVEGVDGIINLAGEPIAGFWTSHKKEAIRESRVATTRLWAKALQSVSTRPKWWINASAVGLYGSRGDQTLDEGSSSGEGFLASVVRDWEAALQPLLELGIRVVKLRFGLVLSPQGGLLKQLKLPFSLGLGGRVGDGKQYMSWIALEDVLGIIHFAMTNQVMQGAFNTTAPLPVTNAVFTQILADTLHRPAIFPLPKIVISTFFGEMGRELLLSSCRAIPKRLLQADYPFLYPELGPLLKHYFNPVGS